MKVGIIGTRSRNEDCDKAEILTVLLDILQRNVITTIVSGGAKKGGDRFAEDLAEEFELPTQIFYPKTFTTPGYLARNVLIAKHSDILIACVDHNYDRLDKIMKSKTGGTNFTVKEFLKYHSEKQLYLV
jgi:hypothetical protein